MDRVLREFAEFVGREWARQWLEYLRSSSDAQSIIDEQRLEDGNHDTQATKSPESPSNKAR
jgi:hypothetical protein